MTRIVLLLLVILLWSISPLLKRVIMDHMASLDDPEHLSPVRTFVALNSLGCTIMAAGLAVSSQPIMYVKRLPAQGWIVLLVAVIVNTIAGLLLAELLQKDNPGITMVYLNAGTNVCTFVIGALFYGKLSLQSMCGVFLISAGVVLTQ